MTDLRIHSNDMKLSEFSLSTKISVNYCLLLVKNVTNHKPPVSHFWFELSPNIHELRSLHECILRNFVASMEAHREIKTIPKGVQNATPLLLK